MEQKVINIQLWTDGSCDNNPKNKNYGVGGWAYSVLINDDIVFEDLGGGYETTSQRMEQTAVYRGLKYLKKKYQGETLRITIHSDSAYVVNCFLQRWFERWYEIDFIGVKNQDLWKKILAFRGNRKFRMDFIHVKGHSGIEMNERVDLMAGEARKFYIEEREKELIQS